MRQISVNRHKQNLHRQIIMDHAEAAADIACDAIEGVTNGMRICVLGLESQQELNGKLGTIRAWSNEKNLWKVKMDDGQKILLGNANFKVEADEIGVRQPTDGRGRLSMSTFSEQTQRMVAPQRLLVPSSKLERAARCDDEVSNNDGVSSEVASKRERPLRTNQPPPDEGGSSNDSISENAELGNLIPQVAALEERIRRLERSCGSHAAANASASSDSLEERVRRLEQDLAAHRVNNASNAHAALEHWRLERKTEQRRWRWPLSDLSTADAESGIDLFADCPSPLSTAMPAEADAATFGGSIHAKPVEKTQPSLHLTTVAKIADLERMVSTLRTEHRSDLAPSERDKCPLDVLEEPLMAAGVETPSTPDLVHVASLPSSHAKRPRRSQRDIEWIALQRAVTQELDATLHKRLESWWLDVDREFDRKITECMTKAAVGYEEEVWSRVVEALSQGPAKTEAIVVEALEALSDTVASGHQELELRVEKVEAITPAPVAADAVMAAIEALGDRHIELELRVDSLHGLLQQSPQQRLPLSSLLLDGTSSGDGLPLPLAEPNGAASAGSWAMQAERDVNSLANGSLAGANSVVATGGTGIASRCRELEKRYDELRRRTVLSPDKHGLAELAGQTKGTTGVVHASV
jgi:hypothetical protein